MDHLRRDVARCVPAPSNAVTDVPASNGSENTSHNDLSLPSPSLGVHLHRGNAAVPQLGHHGGHLDGEHGNAEQALAGARLVPLERFTATVLSG